VPVPVPVDVVNLFIVYFDMQIYIIITNNKESVTFYLLNHVFIKQKISFTPSYLIIVTT
jgi:hypothetical protein